MIHFSIVVGSTVSHSEEDCSPAVRGLQKKPLSASKALTMEKSDPRPKPQGLVSQDDGGLWMKMDSNPGKDYKEKALVTCVEEPQSELAVTSPAPPVIPKFYSGMDDVGVGDDVFNQRQSPSPSSYMSPLLPVEGSRDGTVNNSSLTFANGAADATEAKANPSGLDWHHGEEQLMAVQNELDELMDSTAQASEECTNTASPSKEKDSPQPRDRDSTSMEDTGSLMGPCYDPSGGQHQDNTKRNNKLTEELEDIEILSESQEIWREVEADGSKKYSKEVPLSKNEAQFHRDGEKSKTDGIPTPAETKSKLTTDKFDCRGVKTNAPTPSSHKDRDDDVKPCVPLESCKCNQNNMDEATNQQLASEIATKVADDEDEHIDTRSLNYKLAKYDWVRRESGISETLLPRPCSISEGSVETISKMEQGQGSRGIASNIQQGEQLLQRLQMLQQRQDVCGPENQEVAPEMESEKDAVFGTEIDEVKDRKDDLVSVDESRFHTFEDGEAKANLLEAETESEHIETKAWVSLPTMSGKQDNFPIVRTELGDSEDDRSEIWGPPDWSSTDEMPSAPVVSSRPRLSVAETSLEKQIHEAAQKKQNLQRAGGVFNLADNLDVIEIPFKTNFSLEPLAAKVVPGQRISWQFSEQKMQKEISQEIQRELVLVNQGKIPGAYSKGEVRQLKETKLLFEAFQQENMEGPTRHRKSPTSLSKGQVYPSVLERTRSLEMFSLKSLPLSRAHSLRVHDPTAAQMKKSPEEFRAKSPNGGTRDKTRVSPYQKQDKHARQYRSMDLISTGVSALEARREVTDANTTEESPILQHNPFFKLRPALVLQPEVEKDIREAKEREEELRRQRCTLYGDNRCKNKDKEKSRFIPALTTDATGQSRGKLDRFWPPPSKKDLKPEQTQQETKVRRTAGQKASLWQRWESGQINGQPSQEKN